MRKGWAGGQGRAEAFSFRLSPNHSSPALHSCRKGRGASGPRSATKGPGGQQCLKQALLVLGMALEISRPLPPSPCAHHPKRHLLASLLCTGRTLEKGITRNSLQPGRNLCSVTLAGLVSRCVPILSLPSDSCRQTVPFSSYTSTSCYTAPCTVGASS